MLCVRSRITGFPFSLIHVFAFTLFLCRAAHWCQTIWGTPAVKSGMLIHKVGWKTSLRHLIETYHQFVQCSTLQYEQQLWVIRLKGHCIWHSTLCFTLISSSLESADGSAEVAEIWKYLCNCCCTQMMHRNQGSAAYPVFIWPFTISQKADYCRIFVLWQMI